MPSGPMPVNSSIPSAISVIPPASTGPAPYRPVSRVAACVHAAIVSGIGRNASPASIGE